MDQLFPRLEALQAAVERLKGGETFDPKIESSAEVPRTFKFQRNRVSRKTLMARRKWLEVSESLRLEEWYRYGDSNPGPVAENHVS